MLKVQCAEGYGFSGYCGGLHKLVQDLSLKSCHFAKRPTSYGVLHVGCSYAKTERSLHQYCPKTFAMPIVNAAYNGGATKLAVFVTESFRKNGRPQAALFGDYEDCLQYLSKHTNNPDHLAIYYYHCDIGGTFPPVKCFLDCDYYEDSADVSVSQKKVEAVMTRVNTKLNETVQNGNNKVAIAGSIRHVEGGFKHSYHVTWEGHTFATIEDHKLFMEEAFYGETKDQYDPSVYSRGRCLRAPFSPKGVKGKNMLSAILWPVAHENGDFKFATDIVWHRGFFQRMDIIPRGDDYVTHTVKQQSFKKVHRAQGPTQRVDKSTSQYQRSEKMLQFFLPLMYVLIGKIQMHRRFLMSISAATGGCGVPVGDVSISEPNFSGYEGVWNLVVEGDTFCEYDSPSHYHSKGDKIAISLNFVDGYYNQLCYACRPTGANIKQYNLFDATGISLHPREESLGYPQLDIQSKYGVVLFLQSLKGDVLYHPSFGSTLYVFDPQVCMWVNNQGALSILTKRRNVYRDMYIEYMKNALFQQYFRLKAEAETPEQKKKVLADYQRVCVKDTNKDIQGAAFMENMVSNYSSAFGNYESTDRDLNKYPHLVPFNNGTCFNVFTGETVPRTKDMRIVNCLNTARKDHEDEECIEIRDWFLEISCGRPELALYIQRVIGYACTHLTADRHFYVNLGVGRNGKGALHRLLKVHTHVLECLTVYMLMNVQGTLFIVSNRERV